MGLASVAAQQLLVSQKARPKAAPDSNATQLNAQTSPLIASTASVQTRLLVVSEDVVESGILMAAVNNDTMLVKLQYRDHSLETLAQEIKSTVGAQAGSLISIGFCDHGMAGSFRLLKDLSVNAESVETPQMQNFFGQVSALLMPTTGRIDILACNLTASEEGKHLVARLEEITGVNVCASNNVTGNVSEGDWSIGPDDLDISKWYFEEEKLLLWRYHLSLTDIIACCGCTTIAAAVISFFVF